MEKIHYQTLKILNRHPNSSRMIVAYFLNSHNIPTSPQKASSVLTQLSHLGLINREKVIFTHTEDIYKSSTKTSKKSTRQRYIYELSDLGRQMLN